MIDFEKLLTQTRQHKKVTKKRFKEYWEALQIEKLKSKMLVEELIENAVGTESAETTIKLVQNSYNILQVKEKDRIKVDGVMGEKTIKALNNYKNPLELFVWVSMNQFNYFKNHGNDENFMRSWINERVISNVRDYFEEKE